MQLQTKPKGSTNRAGVIESRDNRRLKYRTIWRENKKQCSKGFETYEEAVLFRNYIENTLIDEYKQQLKNEIKNSNNLSEKDLQHITNLREDLYQAMLIGSIKLDNKSVEDLYNFMNYQDKEIERLNNIIDKLEKAILNTYPCMNMYEQDFKSELLNILKELKQEN